MILNVFYVYQKKYICLINFNCTSFVLKLDGVVCQMYKIIILIRLAISKSDL